MAEIGTRKTSVASLAAYGGAVLFEQPLHVGRPNIGERADLFARLDQALDSHRLSNGGPLLDEFEERPAAAAGVRHAIAVTNGTGALELTVRALDLSGEVIVPSFTFIGTVHALAWMGLTPVFVDISPDRPVLDPAAVERLIGPRTSAILGVHLWVHTCDIERLAAISKEHDVAVIYDAAHAFLSSHGGRPVGSFGHAEIFSFHATKFVNAFEGGAVTTDDGDLAHRLRRSSNFGFAGADRVDSIGTNAKMHEASAAMGLTSLDAVDGVIATNRANALSYAESLADTDGLEWLAPDPASGSAQYVVYRVDAARTGVDRDALLAILRAENILARRYFYPGSHRQEPYRDRSDLVREPLVNSERLAEEVLLLPTGTGVSRQDIEAIAELIRFVFERADEVRQRADGNAMREEP